MLNSYFLSTLLNVWLWNTGKGSFYCPVLQACECIVSDWSLYWWRDAPINHAIHVQWKRVRLCEKSQKQTTDWPVWRKGIMRTSSNAHFPVKKTHIISLSNCRHRWHVRHTFVSVFKSQKEWSIFPIIGFCTATSEQGTACMTYIIIVHDATTQRNSYWGYFSGLSSPLTITMLECAI